MLPPDIRIIRNVLRGHQADLPPHRITVVFSWHPAGWGNNLDQREFYFATCKHFACKDLVLLLQMLFPGFAFTLSLLDPCTRRLSRFASPNEALVSLEAPLYVGYKPQEPSLRGQPLDEVAHFSGNIASNNHEELLPPVRDVLSHDLHGSVPSNSASVAGQPLVEVVSHDHDLDGSAPLSSVSAAGQPLVEVGSHDHEVNSLLPPVPDALSHDLPPSS
jgi:hypothetical protein